MAVWSCSYLSGRCEVEGAPLNNNISEHSELFGKISALIAMEFRQVKSGLCVSIVTEKCGQYVELRVLNVMQLLGGQGLDDGLT
jgi:hypothetical protein